MGLLDRFRRRGPALTAEQRARLSRIVNPQQRQALLDALASGEDIPEYAWTPISSKLDPTSLAALVEQARDQLQRQSTASVDEELERAADSLRPEATATTHYLVPPQECEMAALASRFTPLVGWGIFNPFGPTTSYLALLDVPDRDDRLLLQRMQHPLTQRATLVGLLPATVSDLMPTLRQLFRQNGAPEHSLVAGLPSHILVPPGSPLELEQVRELFWLVAPLSSDAAYLDGVTASLLRHKGNPWERASEGVRAALGQFGRPSRDEAVEASDPAAPSGPNPAQFARWWAAVTDSEHVQSELAAMPSAWEGALELMRQRGGTSEESR
jgi:hypothetical protein